MNTEWGPWIEHDGKGCPCVGKYVNIEFENPITSNTHETRNDCGLSDDGMWFGFASNTTSWFRVKSNYMDIEPVIRYRIRKPKGLTMLETILNELPVPVKQKEYWE